MIKLEINKPKLHLKAQPLGRNLLQTSPSCFFCSWTETNMLKSHFSMVNNEPGPGHRVTGPADSCGTCGLCPGNAPVPSGCTSQPSSCQHVAAVTLKMTGSSVCSRMVCLRMSALEWNPQWSPRRSCPRWSPGQRPSEVQSNRNKEAPGHMR